jgi:integrase
VFATRDGKHQSAGRILKRHLKPAAAKLGFGKVTWHSFRHSAATIVDSFMTGPQKMKLLGHTTVEMGLTYTHPDVDGMRRAMEKAFEGKKGEVIQ